MLAALKVALVAPLVEPLAEVASRGNLWLLADVARGLATRGHDVVVYAAHGSRLPGVRLRTVDVDAKARRRFVLLRENDASESRAMREAFERLFAALRRDAPDVVSQHAFDREAIEASRGLPVLHTLHLPPMGDDVVEALRTYEQPACSVSQTCAAQWSRAVGRDVLAIPNGVPIRGVAVAAADVEPIALVAGRVSREKGTATAIRVARAALLEPAVAGDVYDHAYFDADVRPLPDGVRWLGTLPRPALWRLMSRAAVTLMPIEWDEPFGLVAAEAQLAGCPVVGYRRGALPEIVDDGVGGFLVEPGDEAALVDGVRRAIALDRAAIRRRARARFSIDACVDRYEHALAAVARVPA